MKDDDDDDEKYLPYSCGKLREKSSKIPEREIGKLPTSLQSFQTKNGFFSFFFLNIFLVLRYVGLTLIR